MDGADEEDFLRHLLLLLLLLLLHLLFLLYRHFEPRRSWTLKKKERKKTTRKSTTITTTTTTTPSWRNRDAVQIVPSPLRRFHPKRPAAEFVEDRRMSTPVPTPPEKAAGKDSVEVPYEMKGRKRRRKWMRMMRMLQCWWGEPRRKN